MDPRSAGAAAKLGFTYTRYADGLTFSGPRSADTGAMLDRVRFITAAAGSPTEVTLGEDGNGTTAATRSDSVAAIARLWASPRPGACPNTGDALSRLIAAGAILRVADHWAVPVPTP